MIRWVWRLPLKKQPKSALLLEHVNKQSRGPSKEGPVFAFQRNVLML